MVEGTAGPCGVRSGGWGWGQQVTQVSAEATGEEIKCVGPGAPPVAQKQQPTAPLFPPLAGFS